MRISDYEHTVHRSGGDSKGALLWQIKQEKAKRKRTFGVINTHSITILFGNAHRLIELSARGDYFTEKCMTAAKRSGYALVRTPDLFLVAKYLLETPDAEYAAKCRLSIIETSGSVVTFPPLEREESKENISET